MFEFRLPDVGEGIDSGELVEWHVVAGERVREDQPLCEVETDKAIVALPCPRTGTIVELCAAPGDRVPVGEPLLRMEPAEEGAASEPVGAPAAASVAGPANRPPAAPATRR
ncbi:MAG: 2-oxo acid dehydrogenase subunit E2, partial [Actinobacteria bacterium]|nr:2-oxo acid dehydrogenase subunit E2 [Actinomycetota bacterium]